MLEENRFDFGVIRIHKKVLEDITRAALAEVKGVQIASPARWQEFVTEWSGFKGFSGIQVVIDKAHQVTIDVDIAVSYGLNIPEVSRIVQETIKNAVEKAADVDLKDVNVNVQGIERG